MQYFNFRSFKNTFLLFVVGLLSCGKTKTIIANKHETLFLLDSIPKIKTGAQQTNNYLALLKEKKIGIVSNPTSIIFSQKNKPIHLVDTLLSHNINIQKVFAPEHGFRGSADAGEIIKDGVDIKTGVPIISLYGKNKKPSAKMLQDIELMVFDIQDVGARFYTYISTLHYVMEACAEAHIPLLVLDRPNPNGHYIDGPVLEPEFKSFVGIHPIPIVHGMTIGEYAQMINGEKWLKNGITCKLKISPLKNYTHTTPYALPVKPSPNLPNATAINLYPSLCLFEGTLISVGRGTSLQFQQYGAPKLPQHKFTHHFTPTPNLGAKQPKYEGAQCNGELLNEIKPLYQLNLSWLLKAYTNYPEKNSFFTPFFTKLSGTKILKEQIQNGLSEKEIRASWAKNLSIYKSKSQKYTLYP